MLKQKTGRSQLIREKARKSDRVQYALATLQGGIRSAITPNPP